MKTPSVQAFHVAACVLGLVLSSLVAESAALAASPAATSGMPAFVADIEPAAENAVRVVDEFTAAIKGGRIDDASKLLDPALLVLESGGGEHSRDQYLSEHARADADYMKAVEQDLRYRKARVVDEMAWVATESVMTRKVGEVAQINLSTETMLLRNTKDGWRIVHIHWSSRPVQ